MTQKEHRLCIPTPRWAIPLLKPSRYKGAKGGRSSGKSHFFAELLVEETLTNPHQQNICIREIQKSLRHSAKKLIEQKIRDLGYQSSFRILESEIRRVGGTGIIIFEGMQDHTADSLKSFENFDRAWCEEAQNLSHRSAELLVPTIRKPGSELWFSWNPDQPESAVEKLLFDNDKAVIVHVNYTDNPWCPQEMIDLAEWQKQHDYERYAHIWQGGYNVKSAAQVLSGRWKVQGFTPQKQWDGPYFGQDWGFATDPTTLIKFYIDNRKLYIEREAYGTGVEITDTPVFNAKIEGADKHVIRADSARPEIISHMQQHGYPKMIAAPKWPGSVEDGISWLRSHEIIIHPDCPQITEEARLWSYKIDKKSGDVLPVLKDGYEHGWDAVRYGAAPMIKKGVSLVTTEKQGIEPKATYRHSNGVWISDTKGNLKVWEEPARQYVVGAILQKTALGGAAIQVVEHSSGQQVACWQGEISIEGFAPIVADVCRRYSNAWAVIDIDTNTVPVGHLLKLHKRVYSALPVGHRTGKVAGRREFGFHATHNIDALLAQLTSDVAQKKDGIQDADTLQELNSVRKGDKGVEIDTAVPCERVWALCLARHGASTLPRPRAATIGQAQENNSGWGGHV